MMINLAKRVMYSLVLKVLANTITKNFTFKHCKLL